MVQTSGGGSGRRESAPALMAGYDTLLAYLKSQGCLLNTVKPELLLDITDFRCASVCDLVAVSAPSLPLSPAHCLLAVTASSCETVQHHVSDCTSASTHDCKSFEVLF